MRVSFRRISLVAASLALFSACSSEPTSAPQARVPAPAAPSASLAVGVVNAAEHPVHLPGLRRGSPLTASFTVSQMIGTAGGTLSIPAAGVTVVVPAGALASNTLITMTARRGALVAYDFAPHGITFAKPLVFTQSLNGTSASLLNVSLLALGYYADPSQLTFTGGLVSDLTAGVTNLVSWSFTANIKHFSGYLVSCDRN